MEGISPLSVLPAALACEAEQLSQRCHCEHGYPVKPTESSAFNNTSGNPSTSSLVQSCCFFQLARTDFSYWKTYIPLLSLFICTRMFTDPSMTLSLSDNHAGLALAWSPTQTLTVSRCSSLLLVGWSSLKFTRVSRLHPCTTKSKLTWKPSSSGVWQHRVDCNDCVKGLDRQANCPAACLLTDRPF